jgi:hypothetical protein
LGYNDITILFRPASKPYRLWFIILQFLKGSLTADQAALEKGSDRFPNCTLFDTGGIGHLLLQIRGKCVALYCVNIIFGYLS